MFQKAWVIISKQDIKKLKTLGLFGNAVLLSTIFRSSGTLTPYFTLEHIFAEPKDLAQKTPAVYSAMHSTKLFQL